MSSEGGLLTESEAAAVTSTWSLVQTDLKANGAKFFIHFFTGYPEYQKKFRGFAEIPLDQLSTNKRLIAHGYTVMSAITSLVENLDDTEVLAEMLVNVGRSHSKRNLKSGDFQNLGVSLLEFFAKALGDKWTPEAEAAWKKVLTVLVEKVSEGLVAGATE